MPCIRCGVGDTCEISGLKMLLGPTATVAKAGVKKVEDQPAMEEAVKFGKLIAEILAKEEVTSSQ